MFKVAVQPPEDKVFEDFAEGQEMPVVAKGPMTAGHQVRWAGACDNYASDFHHDAASAREQGLPGLLLSGPLMASFMLTEVTRWLGRRARVASFWDRNTGTTMPGDMAYFHATVKRCWVEDGVGHLDVECWIVNQAEQTTTPGGLTARLPLRRPPASEGS